MHEFKAWQMEYGDADMDWTHHDMDMGGDYDKPDYDKPDYHEPAMPAPGKSNNLYNVD